MTFITYGDPINFGADRLAAIHAAAAIVEEYKAKGFSLSLRQLYYQHVARGLIENSERSYKNLGKLVGDARMNGLISWEAIEDRGREVKITRANEDITAALDGIEWGIVADFWADQDVYLEVWVEKDALSEVVSRACSRYRAPHMACKGYLSLSEAWAAGQRFRDAHENGKECVLIHLGDHDPSGIDMTEDNRRRIELFGEFEDAGVSLDVRRIALNMDQVRRLNPPPNPAKITDSRAKSYIDRFGPTSWELDALDPGFLVKLIRDEIESLVDVDLMDDARRREIAMQADLVAVRDNWDEVTKFLRTLP
jgi:hypothetical protein